MVKWTPEQEDAIFMRGSDILVSAAAGSGKTAVLVERIIKRLLDETEPINIDEILVVTFTNAAAAEMKSRIGKALEDALMEFPNSTHLKKQLSLLPRAQISTLHSFYTRVVRQYAYLFDLDPAFQIADEIENDLIKQDVIDELFEHYYSLDEGHLERFFSVVDRYSSDRSDVQVESLILDIYEFAMQNPKPEKWLNELAETYNIPEQYDEQSLAWLNMLKTEVGDLLASFKSNIERALLIAKESDGPYHYVETLKVDLAIITEAEDNIDDWDQLQKVFLNSKRKNLSGKRSGFDPEKRDSAKRLRDRYTEGWDKLKKRLFSRHLTAHIEDMRELYPVIEMIVELVKQFKERFTTMKRERALVDFLDLEHLCLAIFTDENSQQKQFNPSQIALNYKKQFKEILIDEYQDINLVQETILSLISDDTGRGNRFMVGDVKQSVYRFRHAEPTLFIEKYEQFLRDESDGERIDLAKNFRSRENVLTSANYLFRQIFDIELGEIAYDEKAELVFGNETYNDKPLLNDDAELILIDCDKESERFTDGATDEFAELEKAQLEARAYVEKIKEWVGHTNKPPLQVIDKTTGLQRNIKYSDIAILHRSLAWAQTIVEALTDANIPIYAELRDGYFEAIEIQVMINFLKIIDNPYQDIPLASVLRSPIVRLNEEQLMKIRLTENRKQLFDALKKYEHIHTDDLATTISSFLDLLNSFRTTAREGALSELIWQIYQQTGYYDFVGGMPGGRQRQANLRALYDRSRSYEVTSFRGLFRFLRFIERMEEEDKDLGAARALSEEEDVVKLMTIHKSKGLEFPVVIVGGMNREFNLRDLNKKYLLDKDHGFATKYVDPIKQINYPTLYYHSMREEMLQKQLAEEMRVLYVALTRAKEKIVMIGTVNSAQKATENWRDVLDHHNWVLPKQLRKSARTFLDWVGPALIRHETNDLLRDEDIPLGEHILQEIRQDKSSWTISIIHGSELVTEKKKEEVDYDTFYETVTKWQEIAPVDEAVAKNVDRRLNYRYPHETATVTRAKQSVTEIKNIRHVVDEYSANSLTQPIQSGITDRPAFMQTEKQLTAAEKGSAIHTVMQHLPLIERLTSEQITSYIDKFVARHILREEEATSIDINMIEQFFHTDLAQFIMASEHIEKEVPFTFTLRAKDVYPDWKGQEEKVLIQGVIDLLVYHQSGWSIIDYKTDTIIEDVITDDVIEKLKQRYIVQVDLYKQAVESIIKEPIEHVFLHFLNKQLTIEVIV